MPTYISLVNLTEQGIRTIKDDVNRASVGAHIGQVEGVRIVTEYWTMGAYDAVMILEAPDDETLSRFLLGAGKHGYVRTTTMRAFTKEAMARMLEHQA
jgi:uncharacterized protein with GYD domain